MNNFRFTLGVNNGNEGPGTRITLYAPDLDTALDRARVVLCMDKRPRGVIHSIEEVLE